MEQIVIVSVTSYSDIRIKLGEPTNVGCFTYVKLTVELFGIIIIFSKDNTVPSLNKEGATTIENIT